MINICTEPFTGIHIFLQLLPVTVHTVYVSEIKYEK